MGYFLSCAFLLSVFSFFLSPFSLLPSRFSFTSLPSPFALHSKIFSPSGIPYNSPPSIIACSLSFAPARCPLAWKDGGCAVSGECFVSAIKRAVGYKKRSADFRLPIYAVCMFCSVGGDGWINEKARCTSGPFRVYNRLNYFTITTRFVPLIGKMFCVEPTPFQVS